MNALVKLLLAKIVAAFAAQLKDVDGQGFQACTETPPADDLETINNEAIQSKKSWSSHSSLAKCSHV